MRKSATRFSLTSKPPVGVSTSIWPAGESERAAGGRGRLVQRGRFARARRGRDFAGTITAKAAHENSDLLRSFRRAILEPCWTVFYARAVAPMDVQEIIMVEEFANLIGVERV